jgi:hypothetical protein
MKLIYWEPIGQSGRNEVEKQILDILPVDFARHVGDDWAEGTEVILTGVEASDFLNLSTDTTTFVPDENYIISGGRTHQLYLSSGISRHNVSSEQIAGYLARRQIQARIL